MAGLGVFEGVGGAGGVVVVVVMVVSGRVLWKIRCIDDDDMKKSLRCI